MTSIYHTTGSLLLGSRFKRLSEAFYADLARIYKGEGIEFEPGWFPVFFLLDRHGERTISDLARDMDITHSGASQAATALKKKGLIQITPSARDKRIRTLDFTAQGRELMDRVRPVWQAIQESLESPEPPLVPLVQLLEELEHRWADLDLVDQVRHRLQHRETEMVVRPLVPEEETAFKALVLDWISRDPGALPEQPRWINQPSGETILMAWGKDRALAACGLERTGDGVHFHLISGADGFQAATAQALLQAASATLSQAGIRTLTASPDPTRSREMAWFRDAGFQLERLETAKPGQPPRAWLSKPIIEG